MQRIRSLFGSPWLKWFAVALIAFLPRLILAARSQHVGLWDPTHYYLLGKNLAAGRGFVIDYIWHYTPPPIGVTHPIDHWMPFAGVMVAGGLLVGGDSTLAALFPFVVAGMAQTLLIIWFAGRLGLDWPARLLAGLAASFLPWLFLSSLHTDTTIPFGLFACLSLIGMWLGVRVQPRWLWLSGGCAGLALLTRNDGLLLLPVFVLSMVAYRLHFGRHPAWKHLAGFFVVFGAVILPWALRNQAALGVLWPGSVASSALVRDHEEFYTYAIPLTLDRYLGWGLPNIVGKWIFELSASLKLSVDLTGEFFSVAIGGLLLLAGAGGWRRIRQRLSQGDADSDLLDQAQRLFWALLPALIFVVVAWLFYGIVTPFLSQAGSFKKAFLGVLPLLVLGGAGMAMAFVRLRWMQWGLVALALIAMIPPTFDVVRDDFALNVSYTAAQAPVGEALDALQAQMDDELIVMTRDPWTVNYQFGYRAVMVPDDDLETILEVADRYGATYLWLPVPRPPLEAIYAGEATHPRLERAATIPDSYYEIWRILPPDATNP